VASFGDRPGAYKREIEKLGHVKLYDAFDGAPYCEETSGGSQIPGSYHSTVWYSTI